MKYFNNIEILFCKNLNQENSIKLNTNFNSILSKLEYNNYIEVQLEEKTTIKDTNLFVNRLTKHLQEKTNNKYNNIPTDIIWGECINNKATISKINYYLIKTTHNYLDL